MFCFETSSQLSESCSKVFGITRRFGLPTRPPRLSEKEGIFVSENSAINFVQDYHGNGTAPKKMNTTHVGVDIIFMKEGYVKLTVCYRMFLLHRDSNGNLLSCVPSSLLDMLLNSPVEEQEVKLDINNNVDKDDNNVVSVQSIGLKDSSTSNTGNLSENNSRVLEDLMSSLFDVGT